MALQRRARASQKRVDDNFFFFPKEDCSLLQCGGEASSSPGFKVLGAHYYTAVREILGGIVEVNLIRIVPLDDGGMKTS